MPLPIKIQYSVLDDKGLIARTLVHVPSGTSLANAGVFAGDLAGAIDALIHGQIVSVDICIPFDFSGLGLKTAPDANSDVEEGALFGFVDALGLTYRQRLPTFSEAFILANSRNVDLANAAVQAYTDGIITGFSTVAPTTQSGSDLTALRDAKEQFVKNRKGRRR